jgi:hypothetical protein
LEFARDSTGDRFDLEMRSGTTATVSPDCLTERRQSHKVALPGIPTLCFYRRKGHCLGFGKSSDVLANSLETALSKSDWNVTERVALGKKVAEGSTVAPNDRQNRSANC